MKGESKVKVRKQNKDKMWELRWEDLRDRSVATLFVSNLIVIVWALYEQWDAYMVMWVYWGQSVIIGLFWFLRILMHRNLYIGSLTKSNGSQIRLPWLLRLGAGAFFVLHYGLFHFAYVTFLVSEDFLRPQNELVPAKQIAFVACLFFVNQLLAFFWDITRLSQEPANLTKFMSFPYVRIVPMHFTIFLGGMLQLHKIGGPFILLLFLILKTAADLNGHVKQRKGFAVKFNGVDKTQPIVRRTPDGEKLLVLPDGPIISLTDNPDLAKKIESIEKLPSDIQVDVCRKMLEAEKQIEQQQPKLQCRCTECNIVEGPGAEEYAQHHLIFIRTLPDGTTFEYACPKTKKRWVKAGDFLKAKKTRPGE